MISLYRVSEIDLLLTSIGESPLLGNMDDYGSYELMANLTVSLSGIKEYSNYRRALDLETALHTVSYTANGANFNT